MDVISPRFNSNALLYISSPCYVDYIVHPNMIGCFNTSSRYQQPLLYHALEKEE